MIEAGRHLGLAMAMAALPSTLASAHVQDYQIVRLVSYRSTCDLSHLEDRSAPGGSGLRYFASCANLTTYPDGLDIICDDKDDDRSCRITTPARTFQFLELLAPKR